MTPETEPDHVLAARELDALIAAAGINLVAVEAAGFLAGDNDTQRYSFTLRKGGDEIRGEWSCGSAIPLHAYRDGRVTLPADVRWGLGGAGAIKAALRGERSLDGLRVRQAIRRHFRPSCVDIVSSLLSDANCVDGYADWVDWAEEFGMLDGGAAKVREAQVAFATIAQRAPILRRMLGKDYQAAADAAARL